MHASVTNDITIDTHKHDVIWNPILSDIKTLGDGGVKMSLGPANMDSLLGPIWSGLRILYTAALPYSK